MGYIILSRKQVDGDLNVKLVKNKPVADLQRKQLINQYHDVVILSEDDYHKLGDKVFKHKISNINRNNGGEDNTEHSEHYYDTERNK